MSVTRLGIAPALRDQLPYAFGLGVVGMILDAVLFVRTVPHSLNNRVDLTLLGLAAALIVTSLFWSIRLSTGTLKMSCGRPDVEDARRRAATIVSFGVLVASAALILGMLTHTNQGPSLSVALAAYFIVSLGHFNVVRKYA